MHVGTILFPHPTARPLFTVSTVHTGTNRRHVYIYLPGLISRPPLRLFRMRPTKSVREARRSPQV